MKQVTLYSDRKDSDLSQLKILLASVPNDEYSKSGYRKSKDGYTDDFYIIINFGDGPVKYVIKGYPLKK